MDGASGMGWDGDAAAARIERENPYVEAILVPGGSFVRMDYKWNKLRVWVNNSGMVFQVP